MTPHLPPKFSHSFHGSVSTQYLTTLYCRPRASKLSTAPYPRKYGYEQTCSSQVPQQKRKGRCSALFRWCDLDSAWGTCVNRTALIIDACLLSKSNLRGHLSVHAVADLAISVLEAGLVLV